MPCLLHIFTAKELEKLDERSLRMLDEAIIRELQTSEQIRNFVRKKLRWSGKGKGKGGLYTQMTATGRKRAK
jgi:hypothetical protein